MLLFKLFGDDKNEKELPPFKDQLNKFIDEIKLKWKKRSTATKVIASALGVLFLYLIGVITTIVRFFGTATDTGITNAEKISLNPFVALFSLLDIRYSIWGILIGLFIVAAALYWYIRNTITLGTASVEERGGATFKRQVQDATCGSSREMTEEEITKNFCVVSESEMKHNNPNTIIYGKLPKTGDYLCGKKVRPNEAPNINSFVCGPAESRKSTNFAIPLCMQICRAGMNAVINDPSTEICKKTYRMFIDNGYEIKILNTIHPKHSNGWNFIGCVGSDIALSKVFAQTILESTQKKASAMGEQYWTDGMLNLFAALMLYVNLDEEHNNIKALFNLVVDLSLDEVEKLFSSLDKKTAAYREFLIYKKCPVQANIMHNLAIRLDIFIDDEISDICSINDINIVEDLGSDKKCVIYIMTSADDLTYAFISSLFFNASVKQLSAHARDNCSNMILPHKCHYVMDEVCLTGHIPELPNKLSADRKYGLVFHLFIQSYSQFLARYEELEAEEIMSNCKYKLCFACGDPRTAELFEKYAGPTTARTSMTSTGSPILRTTDQAREGEQQRMLWDYSELMRMDITEYVLFITNMYPIKLLKPYYMWLPDAEQMEDFNISTYFPHKDISVSDFTDSKTNSETIETENEKTVFTEIHVNSENKGSGKEVKEKQENSNKSAGQKKTLGKAAEVRVIEMIESTENTEPPLYKQEEGFYRDRPCENDDEVLRDVRDNNVYFKDRDKMRAYKLAYDIPTDVEVQGTVPQNRWMTFRSSVSLTAITNQCKLKKDGYILVGWQYVKQELIISKKSFRKYYLESENKMTIPQCDILLQPIFKEVWGNNKDDYTPKQPSLFDEDNNAAQKTDSTQRNTQTRGLKL